MSNIDLDKSYQDTNYDTDFDTHSETLTNQGYAAIVDANLNRVTEGLRVIEDYVRFVVSDTDFTNQLATLRHQINQSFSGVRYQDQLKIRDIDQDVRAKEPPPKRQSCEDLLKANFKRVTEGLRVLEEYTGQAQYNQFRYDVYQLEKTIFLTVLKPAFSNGIYLISHDVDILKKGLEWGVSMIQLRDKTATKSEILEKAKEIQPHARSVSIPFIVNDYLDVALLVDADGFHSGQDDLSVTQLRKLLGAHKLLGRTTHTLAQGKQAEKEGADYVSVGPIWETPSKPDRDPIGFSYLEDAKTALQVPYVAIGGICLDNCQTVLSYQPPLVGLIRDYQHIPKIQEYLAEMR